MHIIHVAAELAPLAKVGGLADVVLGLSKMQNELGHPTAVFIPGYDAINPGLLENVCPISALKVRFNGKEHLVRILKGSYNGLTVFLTEDPDDANFFSRKEIYGFEDDPERFIFFSKIFAEFLKTANPKPEIIHLHDWQTAIIAPLIKNDFQEVPKIVLTVHNMEYQGRTAPKILAKIDLDPHKYFHRDLLKDSIYPETLNLLKSGLIYSDFVTTVSPTYCREVKTKEFGTGLNKLLNELGENFQGILNGIDYDYWNPLNDKFLPPHDFTNLEHDIRDFKNFFKRTLRNRFRLQKENVPLLGAICRLVPQKGTELLKEAITFTEENGGQFVLLGTSPITKIQEEFENLAKKYNGRGQIEIFLNHSEETAHLIYAASDMLVIPSIFEPCGLTQMIALRYGSIPIVRSTGGLADTIFDIGTSIMSFEKTNGFTFKDSDPLQLKEALKRAFDTWHDDPQKWWEIIVNGMKCDFSWKNSAESYLRIYNNLLKGARTL